MAGRRGPGLVLLAEIVVCALALCALLLPEWAAGLVYVRTVPAGALVRLSSGLAFTSPARVPVAAGGTGITVSLPGYATSDTTVTLRDSSVTVTLAFVFEVTVTSTPPGAAVSLDGLPAGSTPVSISISEPGRHVLEATSPGSLSMSDTIVLASNRPRTVHFDFPAMMPQGLVSVPGSTFVFGESGEDPSLRRTTELGGFLISSTEVTNSQFCSFLESVDSLVPHDSTGIEARTGLLGSFFRCDYPLEIEVTGEGFAVAGGRGPYPVRGICWEGASAYCDWLSAEESGLYHYRLPTEAEWEYAASTGDGRKWPWGDSRPTGALLNCSDRCEAIANRDPGIDDGFPETAPVGSFPPNPWGLYDMSGNVWEWCSDWAGGHGSGAQESLRCLRGGSWLSSADDCSCFSRLGLTMSLGYPFAGFRVAADRLPGRAGR